MRLSLVAALAATCLAGVLRAETIDTLDFFVTKHPERGLTGAHPLTQTVIGDRSYYVKWAPEAFEVHRIDRDAGIIYLEEDHETGAGDYTLLPGPWLKTRMEVGERIPSYGAGHMIRRYKADCSVDTETRFDYETVLEAHLPSYDLGGDLGKQDVIVVGYGLPGTGWERDYYSREWGWVKWEEYAGDKTTLKNTSVFNKLGAPIRPRTEVACAARTAPGGACPPAQAYDETRPDAIAKYCAAIERVSCPGGYVGSLSCRAAPGWKPYGASCAPPSCSGCGCVAGGPATPPAPGGGCPAGQRYQERNPDAIARYCREAQGWTCDNYVSALSCVAAPGWTPYGPDCAMPSCTGCGCAD